MDEAEEVDGAAVEPQSDHLAPPADSRATCCGFDRDGGSGSDKRCRLDDRAAMQRADLAAFLVDEAERAGHVREIVGVTS